MTFGSSVRALRVARGQSLDELARIARIPCITLEEIERDEHYPRLRELDRLLDALNVSLRSLLRHDACSLAG